MKEHEGSKEKGLYNRINRPKDKSDIDSSKEILELDSCITQFGLLSISFTQNDQVPQIMSKPAMNFKSIGEGEKKPKTARVATDVPPSIEILLIDSSFSRLSINTGVDLVIRSGGRNDNREA